jgi:hypothetical protein
MKANLSRKWSLAALTLGLGLAAPGVQAQHLNAGALSTAQDGQLYFNNASGFVNGSGFVITSVTVSLNYSNSGTYAGYFNSGNPTFTALAQTTANGATPSPNAAAFGSFLQLRLESVVSGPVGGTFSFFDDEAVTPTYSLGVGSSVASGNLFELSDATLGAGAPGADPYGHIHGRRFAVDLPGSYLVGFRLVDTSVNGIGGGPIQSDSQLYLLTYNTVVPEPTVASLVAGAAVALGLGIRRQSRNQVES